MITNVLPRFFIKHSVELLKFAKGLSVTGCSSSSSSSSSSLQYVLNIHIFHNVYNLLLHALQFVALEGA